MTNRDCGLGSTLQIVARSGDNLYSEVSIFLIAVLVGYEGGNGCRWNEVLGNILLLGDAIGHVLADEDFKAHYAQEALSSLIKHARARITGGRHITDHGWKFRSKIGWQQLR